MNSLMLYLKELLAARGLTQVDFCEMLGYKSKTALLRILNGSVRTETLRKFESLTIARLALGAAERKRLAECLTELQYGTEHAEAIRALERFLRQEQQPSEPFRVLMPDGAVMTLGEYASKKTLTGITVFNFLNRRFFDSISGSFAHELPVSHYIRPEKNASAYICCLEAIRNVFSHSGYAGYFLSGEQAPYGMNSSNAAIFTFQTESGASENELLYGIDAGLGRFVPFAAPLSELTPPRDSLNPLRLDPSKGLSSLGGFIAALADLEQNCTIYDLKPDFCIAHIPTGILLKAFTESGFAEALGHDVLVDLYNLSARREQNTYGKRKPSHLIMKRSALNAFARSGRLSDHLAGLRPFMPKERCAIFERVLDAVLNNPYFNLYLLDEEALYPNMNFCCYSGRAVYLSQAKNDYLGSNAVELIIEPPAEFFSVLEHFIGSELIFRHTLKQSDVIAFLKSAIETCKELTDGKTAGN